MKFFMGFWILPKIPTAALSQLYSHVKKTLRKDLESVTKTEANRSAWLIAHDYSVPIGPVFQVWFLDTHLFGVLVQLLIQAAVAVLIQIDIPR